MEITGERGEVVKCTNNSSDEEFLKENRNVASLIVHDDHNKQALGATLLHDNKSGHCRSNHVALPFYPIVGGARSSQSILAMQPSDIDKKREAFLEYLKQKYPHHASVIMGHQERLREQNWSASDLCSSLLPAVRDQSDLGSLTSLDAFEIMSECEVPVAFTRGSRTRASLPVVRSANQTKDRSLGVLYLQYGDETKQIRMPNEITTVDTVQALFVSAFPQQLSMKMLESPSTAIYVKDDLRNMYYELSDVRSITDQSCLKVYHKDPVHAFSHAARPSSGEARMHRETMYTSRDAPPLMRQTSNSPSMSPTSHSITSLPSRIPFGPRSSGGGATMSRERAGHPLATPTRSASPSPSAILERRDVKPDEDLSAKAMGRGGEGIYGDPFLLHHNSPTSETLDQGYHRASIRSYGMTMEPTEHHSLFRQKSWKTPPSSPHRMGEMRMTDIQASQSQSPLTIERSSPVRQSFRKEGPIAVEKAKNAMGSHVATDLQGHGLLVQPGEPQTRERMRAMEEQLASLTGLVQHALLKAPSIKRGDREHVSDRPMKSGSPVHSISSTGGSSPVLGTKIASESSTNPTPPNGTVSLQVNLSHFRRNISGLRLQLQQMRQLQLQNQECVRAQIKQAEQEISARLAEVLRRQEDPAQRQRALVEEERHKYLSMEESVLTQLGDLEQYVESVRRDSSSATAARPITLKEVEEGAVGLRKVGESLAALKGDFPVLQGRMRAVLRVEVEAVKFLKEEPHKLDSMLKRVKSLTETLSTLRRNATEGLLKPDSVITTMVDEAVAVPPAELHSTVPLFEPQRSSLSSEAVNSKTLVPQCTQRSFPPTPELPTKTSNTQKVEICSAAQPELAAPLSSSGGLPLSIARCNGSSSSETSNLFIEEIISHSKGKNRAPSIEAAEKEWEEKRQSLSHYDGLGFEKMLQEAEAKMLRGIPIMEGAVDGIRPSPAAAPPLATEERVENPKPSALQTQEDKQPDPPSFEKSTKTGSDKAPKLEKATKAALGKPVMPNLSIKSSMERQPKSKDKATKTSQSSEKASKSPPPPPPRRNYINSTGVTSTRSGEVIYGSRKESGSAQEVEVDVQNPASRHAPRSPLEVKPKPCTPLPVTASANLEEEDEGNKIMAELQVFQKCLVKDIELKGLVEPQIKEIRSGALLHLKEKKQNAETQENKDLVMDENGNNAIRQNAGVIYYVTAQISKESPEESTDNRAASQSSPSQVSKVNTYEKSQNKLLVSPDGLSGVQYPDNIWSLPSDLPHTPLTRSSSLKTKKQDPGSPTQGKVHVVKVPQVQLSIEETVESPTAICTPVSLGRPDLIHPKAPAIYGELTSANPRQEFSVNKTREKFENVDDESETFLSPDLPGEEPPPPPPDNIAFMITNTKVQALSTGEYRDLVKAKKGNVQTVTVGSKPQNKHGSDISTVSSNGFDDAENSEFSKKPVIIIFDEPMDIRLAYKRLSTIFECEEELERMLTKERIEEESEETEDEDKTNVQDGNQMNSGKAQNGANLVLPSSLLSDGGTGTQATTDPKQDVKKKFKFKFPKKQLAALTQAIRTGTKTGKKTLQVVVYEDEEESDGTIKQHKETKRFEISCSKEDKLKSESTAQEPHGRTEEIRKSAYKTLDSLEQTIKQLETTISEMGPKSSDDLLSTKSTAVSSKLRARQGAEALDKVVPQKALVTKSSSSSKRPSLRKKPKPQLLPRPAGSNTTGVSVNPAPPQQNVSVASPTSRMPVPMSAKTRQQLGTSDRERATKQLKLQDSQRQFRQANGSAKRSGGDPKSTSPTMSASKIPAFSTSAGKGASQPDATNPVNHSVVPSSSSSSSSSSKSSIPNPRSIPNSSSHIPSLSNGSIKHAQSTHNTKTLSLSTQTQNGRYSSSSSSSSSHSPLSPTMLSQVSKSIRTIHTPSFVSYTRPHSGNSGKSAIPTATSTKDAS